MKERYIVESDPLLYLKIMVANEKLLSDDDANAIIKILAKKDILRKVD